MEVGSPVVVPRVDRGDALLAHQDGSKGGKGLAGWSVWRSCSPRAALSLQVGGGLSQGRDVIHDHRLDHGLDHIVSHPRCGAKHLYMAYML